MIKSDNFKYITLSALMESVKADLHLYEASSMIDEDRVIKTIRFANEKLGYNIYKPKQCSLLVRNYKADLPEDFWKLEMLFALRTTPDIYMAPFPANMGLDFSTTAPLDREKLVTINKTACVDSCNKCIFVTQREPHTDRTIRFTHFTPLDLSDGLMDKCTSYCPNSSWNKGAYRVDLQEDFLRTSFKDGELFLSYLGDLIDEEGNYLIPFNPIVYPYYEWTVKEKILEDIYMNSEADVLQKLQYAREQKSKFYIEAWNYVSSAKSDQMDEIRKKQEMSFFNKYYKMFS